MNGSDLISNLNPTPTPKGGNMKKQLLFAAGLTFLVGTGIGPAPDAGAQPIPTPCEDCNVHNSQPGNGPGMTVQHYCDPSTGEGGITSNINNKTGQVLVVELVEASGLAQARDIPVGGSWTALWPAGEDDTVQFVHRVFNGVDRGPGLIFNCPCDQVGPVPTPPATIPPGGPGVPPTTVATPPVTVVGRLPSVGIDAGLLVSIAGLCFVLAGLLFVTSKRST